jgi:hypothetical protein
MEVSMQRNQDEQDAYERWFVALEYVGYVAVGPKSQRDLDLYPLLLPWQNEVDGPFNSINPDTSKYGGDMVAAYNAEIARIHAWVESQKKADHRADLDIIRGWIVEGLTMGQMIGRLNDRPRSEAMKLIKEAEATR